MRQALSDQMPDGVVPDRDWARVYQLYQAGFHALLTEQREMGKLEIAMRRLKNGDKPLTDEEYQREVRDLAIAALRELPTADLAAELAARGLTLPVVSSSGD